MAGGDVESQQPKLEIYKIKKKEEEENPVNIFFYLIGRFYRTFICNFLISGLFSEIIIIILQFDIYRISTKLKGFKI